MIPPDQQSYDREHRRETLLYFIVPLLVAVVTVLVGVVIVLLLRRQMQVSIIADWMVTVFFLCPAVICGFIMCVLFITMVFLMNRAQGAILRPVRWAEEKSQNVAARADEVSDTIIQKISDFASNFAFLDRILSIFDEPVDDEKSEENDAGTTTQ